jgi:hypothetical protein
MQYGGRFAGIAEPPDYSSSVVVDSTGALPDLRYPVHGQLLERAPLLMGKTAANRLVVARLDLGTAATTPFTASLGLYTARHFPSDEAALVVDSQRVAWLIDLDGVKRLADHVVTLPQRNFTGIPGEPDLVLMALRLNTGAPFELVAVDRPRQRLVTLSRQAFVSTSPSYSGACDVPGPLAPGGRFIYFAETTAQPGEIALFLVKSDFSEAPRRVGTTLANRCRVPVVSRDGTRVAVQETLGGPASISVAPW